MVPPAAPPATPPAPEPITLSSQQLGERLKRDREAHAHALGYDSVEAMETALAEAKTLREAEE